jgi:hypothetical protein
MPCYVVSEASVDIKAANFSLLEKGLANDKDFILHGVYGGVLHASWKGQRFTLANGQVTVEHRDQRMAEKLAGEIGNAVNRAYSKQVVKHASQKMGWAVEQTGDLEFNVTKRSA